jgi:hypothetical protein
MIVYSSDECILTFWWSSEEAQALNCYCWRCLARKSLVLELREDTKNEKAFIRFVLHTKAKITWTAFLSGYYLKMDNVLVNLDDAIAQLDDHHPDQEQQQPEQQQGQEDAVLAIGDVLASSYSPDPPTHPVVVVSQSRACNSSQLQDDEVLVDQAIEYLHWHALHTNNCPHLSSKKGRTNNCSCMSVFAKDVQAEFEDSVAPLTLATARFMTFFAKLERSQQQQYVMFWF